LSGNEPEAARIFSSSLLPPAEPGALLERLKQFLSEGTPQQKIEAWRALAPNQLSLSTDDQLQLRLAQRLLEALQSNHDDQIYDAYHKLEFSTLSKHFSFTLEDLQRIQKINNARVAIQQWRTTLRSAGKSVRLLVDTYQMLPSPHSFLSPEELHIAETAQAFVHSTMDEQQTIHAHGFSRVHLYDELFFSPYHFTFTASETKAIEQERELLRIPWPLLAQVNQTRIDGAQFFALFITIPLFAETQVSPLVQQQAKDRSVTRRQELQEYITYWRKLSEPYALPRFTLDTLVRQALLEQGLNTEAEKNRRALEKEILQIQDEYFKELRTPLAREERKTLLPLSEQHWRGALLPFAQQEVLTRHLQTTAPGQTLENWLSERRHAATIRYHERPAANSPLSLDQHASWPFKWWFLRPFITSQQGETEHA
jgi:hypothetical protein